MTSSRAKKAQVGHKGKERDKKSGNEQRRLFSCERKKGGCLSIFKAPAGSQRAQVSTTFSRVATLRLRIRIYGQNTAL